MSSKQAKVDKLYAGLKEMSEVRKLRLADLLRLYELNRSMDDLEIWLVEREIVAKSHELGIDFEHITVSSYTLCNPILTIYVHISKKSTSNIKTCIYR